jgi:hypothetical protein
MGARRDARSKEDQAARQMAAAVKIGGRSELDP